MEGGGCRANFLGVLPSKQFKNVNHIGSRRFLEHCSHAAGTVAGRRAAHSGQEGWQLGEAWPWLEEGAGSWQPAGSNLLLLSRWALPAVGAKMRHQEVLTSTSLTLCAYLSRLPHGALHPCGMAQGCCGGQQGSFLQAVSHREGERLPLKLSLLL